MKDQSQAAEGPVPRASSVPVLSAVTLTLLLVYSASVMAQSVVAQSRGEK